MVSEQSTTAPGRSACGNGDPKRSLGGAAETGATGAGTPVPARILIVEDEWFIAIESEAVLREAGFHVVGIAVTAEEAVAMAERHEPHLVLMDIRLRGERNGVDAAREIRSRFDIPCLFATAHAEQGVRDSAQTAVPAGWLTKPFSDRQLVAAVKSALTA